PLAAANPFRSGIVSRSQTITLPPMGDCQPHTHKTRNSLYERILQQRRRQYLINRGNKLNFDLILHVVWRHLHVSFVFLRHKDLGAASFDSRLKLRQYAANGKYLPHDCNLTGHGEVVADWTTG